MNAVKCPSCGRTNSAEDNFCLDCGTSISVLNRTPNSYAPLSSPRSNQSYGFNAPDNFSPAPISSDNRTGRRIYIGYKLFCAATVAMSLVPIAMGMIAIAGNKTQPTPKEQTDAINGGIIFILYGLVYFVPFALGLILPKTPVHWILGIALLLISLIPVYMTSCIFIPAAIALLVFWFKPETKAYFGRT